MSSRNNIWWNGEWSNNVINVKDYGAKGDGINDDSSAIQNAINDAINNKRNIIFTEGSYYITNEILFDFTNDESTDDYQKCMYIYGYNAKIIHNNTTTGKLFKFKGKKVIDMRGFNIVNNVQNGECITTVVSGLDVALVKSNISDMFIKNNNTGQITFNLEDVYRCKVENVFVDRVEDGGIAFKVKSTGTLGAGNRGSTLFLNCGFNRTYSGTNPLKNAIGFLLDGDATNGAKTQYVDIIGTKGTFLTTNDDFVEPVYKFNRAARCSVIRNSHESQNGYYISVDAQDIMILNNSVLSDIVNDGSSTTVMGGSYRKITQNSNTNSKILVDAWYVQSFDIQQGSITIRHLNSFDTITQANDPRINVLNSYIGNSGTITFNGAGSQATPTEPSSGATGSSTNMVKQNKMKIQITIPNGTTTGSYYYRFYNVFVNTKGLVLANTTSHDANVDFDYAYIEATNKIMLVCKVLSNLPTDEVIKLDLIIL